MFKRIALVAASFFLMAFAAVYDFGTTPNDRLAVEQTAQLYFEGLMKYDAASLRKAFHPDARVVAALPNRYFYASFEEWVQFTKGKPPENPSEYVNQIVSIDITGNAAVVKTDLQWPKIHYIDYLSLIKIDGDWKIINKIWHQESKGQ
jgi:hypothetical protein